MYFTQNWIDNQDIVPHWEKHLVPLAGKAISLLEIGSYEGRSAVWFLEHVLTHPKAKITCVDTFKGDSQQVGMGVSQENIKERFLDNTRAYEDKVTAIQGRSHDILKTLKQDYDIVYVDGSHYQTDVLEDMVLAFDVLKPGGIMVCDDYGMTYETEELLFVPRLAIDAFVSVFEPKIETIHVGWQYILRKK